MKLTAVIVLSLMVLLTDLITVQTATGAVLVVPVAALAIRVCSEAFQVFFGKTNDED